MGTAKVEFSWKYVQMLCMIFFAFLTSQDFKSLYNQLSDFMAKATEEKPLVLILDSLHRLTGACCQHNYTPIPFSILRGLQSQYSSRINKDKYEQGK